MIFGRKRWHCARCEHVWDDARKGPAEMTRLEPGDPRPVFRLRRAHAGMGLMLGLVAGFFAAIVLRGGLGVLVGIAATAVAWILGAAMRYEVCSEPQCRAPLPPDAEECPGCKGTLAGEVRAAADHYAAAADVRREMAALRGTRKKATGKKAAGAGQRIAVAPPRIEETEAPEDDTVNEPTGRAARD